MKRIILSLCCILASTLSFAQQENDSSQKHISIDEVTVNASRTSAKLKDLPQKVEVIQRAQLKSLPVQNVGDALKLSSGIDIIKYPGILSTVAMRGFAPTTNNKYNLLLINGMPAGTKNIASLGISNVEQIEIMKGPFSSMYGSSAMAGVINIVTPRSKGALHGGANVSMGSFMTSHADVSAGGTIAGPVHFDLNIATDNQGADYTVGRNNLLKLSETEAAIVDTKTTSGETFHDTKFSQMTGDLRLGADIGRNWQVHLTQSAFAARDVLSHGSFWSVYGADKKDMDRYAQRLELEGTMGRHSVSIRPYHSLDNSKNYSDNTDSAFVYYQSIYRTYGMQLQDRIQLGAHALVLGVDNCSDINQSKRWASDTARTSPYIPDYRSTSNAVFAQLHARFFSERLNISAGGRYDLIEFALDKTDYLDNDASSDHHQVFSPNIGARFSITSWLDAHSSWGTAFLSPDASQKSGNYTYNGRTYRGNTSLRPESSQTFDAGAGIHSRKSGVSADATWFTTVHDDLIISRQMNPDGVAKSGDEYVTYDNAQEAKMNGLEIEASYNVGALAAYRFSCKLYANATLMFDATMQVNDSTELEQKYVRDRTANFGIDFCSARGMRLRLNGRYIGSRVEDNWYGYYSTVRPELARLTAQTQTEYSSLGLLRHPDFLVFDASASYPVTTVLSLGCQLSNILDENYTEKDGYNMPGRSVMFTAGLHF